MTDQAIAIVPQMNLSEFKDTKNLTLDLVKKKMREGKDYGVIPGTKKRSLLQPGAEKLCKFFGLVPEFELMKEVENFELGLFYYKYKCRLKHFATQKFAGEAERVCHSNEKKYNLEYGKVVSPQQKAEKINTIMAMAQKRALVAAVRQATMATEIFDDSQDVDMEESGTFTKEENPERTNLMRRMFAVAKEKAFTEDLLNRALKKKYQVGSLNDFSNEQLLGIIEKLETEFVPGGVNGQPAKIDPVQEAEVVKPNPIDEMGKKADEELIKIAQEVVEEPIMCRFKSCDKRALDGKYFCSNEHEQQWKDGTYNGKHVIRTVEDVQKVLKQKSLGL